jgi:hypothetical protein
MAPIFLDVFMEIMLPKKQKRVSQQPAHPLGR